MSTTPTVIPAPNMLARPWMAAMESQLEAYTTIERVFNLPDEFARRTVQEHGFAVDRALLKYATPFMWSREVTQSVLEASKLVPADTPIAAWNLDTSAVWWWFEEPLPYPTLNVEGVDNVGVRALCFGWLEHYGKKSIGCSAWVDSYNDKLVGMNITPSQTWVWSEGKTLEKMLTDARDAHNKLYGPGGKHAGVPIVGVETFLVAAEGLSRFVLAGLTWLAQRVILDEPGHIERHRRKDFNRRTGQDLQDVRVIALRKIERKDSAPKGCAEHEVPQPDCVACAAKRVEWSCWWRVIGHFRNQPYGPGRTMRKLVWIEEFSKGDQEKPFKPARPRVYAVNR